MTIQETEDYLAIHHIGSRGGSRSFPVNLNFESEIINVLYDADQDCLDQVEKVNENLESKLVIYPYCISNEQKDVEFFVTYDPNLSSLFKPKKMNLEYYYFSHSGYDYNFNELSKITKVINIETTTLDILLEQKKSDFVMPDFLSLDTQGSELEILDGSPVCLSNTLAVILETEFIEFYEGQPSFENILKFMKNEGFEFIRFTNIVEQNSYNYPIGLRSQGRLTDADALFIRSPEYLKADARNNLSSFYKLAYIYVSFDMLESALECMKIIEKNWKLSDNLNFHRFLNELYKCSNNFKQYPKKYSDYYSVKQSHSRYSVETYPKSSFKVLLNKLGPLTTMLKMFRDLSIKFINISLKLAINIKFLNKRKKSEMEILLEKNGFHSLAKLIYDNRINFYKRN